MRLIELSLFAPNLEDMRQFYCAILGLREVEAGLADQLIVEAGSTRLIFLQAPEDWHGRYHFAFDVPPQRLDAAVSWLRQRRGLISNAEGQTRFHSDTWNADNVYFYDTQGNILELIARHDRSRLDAGGDPALADRPFNASEVMAITEIGLTVDSVADTVASLTTRIPGLGVYSGAGDDQFTAVGDIHGLLIVVRAGRIWFPDTSVPAVPLPVDLLLEVENGQRWRVTAPPYPFSIHAA